MGLIQNRSSSMSGTKERPDLNKEAAVEAQLEIPGANKKQPGNKEPKAAEPPAHRMVNFNGKIIDVAVKQGDTRLLKIVVQVSDDVPRVNSELLSKFQSSEYLFFTVEPLQLHTTRDTRFKDKVDGQETVPTKTVEEGPTTRAKQPGEKFDPDPTGKTEDYMCPFCQAMHRISKDDTRVMLTCLICGKEWPIKLPPAPADEKTSDAALAEAEAPADPAGDLLAPEERDPDTCVRCLDKVGREHLNAKMYCDKCWREIEKK